MEPEVKNLLKNIDSYAPCFQISILLTVKHNITHKICNYKFLKGFIFSSSNFDNTSKTTPFPVSFIIWEINDKYNIKTENIILDVLDDNSNIIDKKDYNVIESDKLLNKWIKREKTL